MLDLIVALECLPKLTVFSIFGYCEFLMEGVYILTLLANALSDRSLIPLAQCLPTMTQLTVLTVPGQNLNR